MIDIIKELTNWLKTHPIVSFAIAMLPVFGFAFALSNTFFQSTIDEYRSQIDVLKYNETLVSTFQSTKIPSSVQLIMDSACNTESQKLSRPAINDLYIFKGDPKLIWDGEVKILITKLLDSPVGANVTLFIGESKQDFLLYSDNRETFSFNGHDYFLDLLRNYTSSSVIAITPKSATTNAYKTSPSIGLK